MTISTKHNYDLVIIGAGHAGCEAAIAAARLGSNTLLITMDMDRIAQMSCNPAIGGIAKGQIVREIDALGGLTGIISDRASIQFRMLNRSKGPAMWSPRAQCDRIRFRDFWRAELERQEGLDLIQDEVEELLFTDKSISGVRTLLGRTFSCRAVILTAGTFLGGLMHFGRQQIRGGRIAEFAADKLALQLRALGIPTDRMKTGTPARVDARSIHLEECTPQYGDNDFHRFSFLGAPEKKLEQRPCYITYTNSESHRILSDAIEDSPLYNGQIQSIGPRYCPSIETKIVTFPTREKHQLFLEPEGEQTTEYYINGFSSSLPPDVQERALRAIPALRDVHIFRPGYAIEYDFYDPRALKQTLESKLIPGLFLAGQVNGTTGYEEAASQGLMAGINAHIAIHGGEPFVLSRDEAYIGVLIDDLITKGVDEPYRMFTSRAEYRILLRQDSADERLTPRSYALGLATRQRYDHLQEKLAGRERILETLRKESLLPEEINTLLTNSGQATIKVKTRIADLLARPAVSLSDLIAHSSSLKQATAELSEARREETLESAEILVKYQGYIDRERDQADKLHRLENLRIPEGLVYADIVSLSTEARQKLAAARPRTIGQASRIPGISPHDVGILIILAGR